MRVGRRGPALALEWEGAEAMVKGHPGAEHRACSGLAEALSFAGLPGGVAGEAVAASALEVAGLFVPGEGAQGLGGGSAAKAGLPSRGGAGGGAGTPGGAERRTPRYFDDASVFEENTKRCYRCGQAGHLARDCTFAARAKPCYLCGELGHQRWECPNTICFRCGKPGHFARDCTHRGPPDRRACIRCGRWECRDPECQQRYLADDLKLITCYVCGKAGHLCCNAGPRQRPRASCFVCGGSGHEAGSASCPYITQQAWQAPPHW